MADDITLSGYGGQNMAQPVYGKIEDCSGGAVNVALPFDPSIVEIMISTDANNWYWSRRIMAFSAAPHEVQISDSSGTISGLLSTIAPVANDYAGTDGKVGFTIAGGYLDADDTVAFIAWP